MDISIKSILNLFHRPATALVVFGLLIIATVGAKARVWRHPTLAASGSQQVVSVEHGPVQMVHFTVYDAGIFPREVRVGAGLVGLYIEDMSRSSAGLVLANESLQPLAQIISAPARWRGNTRVSLLPGRYKVYEAGRPTNAATLIVEP
jgi:hypothetical protein